ncbi:MAG: fumarylacetoacetate hydrolase family protein [Flavobacteriales bacterium]
MKILCVGRNYREHASELGNDVPAEPLFFSKPSTALLPGGGTVPYPTFTRELHFETELVLRIGTAGQRIDEAAAENYIEGIGIGLDLTARDVQRSLKEKGHPWTKAKGFDRSAPVSEDFMELSAIPDLGNLEFGADKNGRTAQEGNSGDMIFPFATLLAHISRYMTLQKGDLIFTGTPSGVGPLDVGDHLNCWIGRRSFLDISIE